MRSFLRVSQSVASILVGFVALAAVAGCSASSDAPGDADAAGAPPLDAATLDAGASTSPPPPIPDASAADATLPDAGASPPNPAADASVTDASPADAAPACTPVFTDPHAKDRAACTFAAGARVADTLGLDDAGRAALPITHLLVIVEENRSFDHYYGKLSAAGQPEAEGWPASFANPDGADASVPPTHLTTRCLPVDPPHQGQAMQEGWDQGKMDGFVKSAAVSGSNGHFAMGYYDGTDLPFYYWLANNYAIADRYFGSTLGGTWANRDYLYAGTSDGVTDTGQATISARTIYDALTDAKIGWAVYTDGDVRQNCLAGWTDSHAGVAPYDALIKALGDGTLPPVSFADPGPLQDEHPTANVNGGETWVRQIYQAAVASPLWPHLAIVFTYDESGGLADHVAPPKACLASPDQTAFDRYGMRVPAFVLSPWARPHYVSHVVHDHTSTLRLVEALFDLPALTARDANADALLDMFDFTCGPHAPASAPPSAGSGNCN
ncbi:MAG TPA: alkaline phosphatase family protein [Polyangiaceae bacterium]